MDKDIEAFRSEVLRWRGSRRRGARRYPSAMRAKALALVARLRERGLTADAAAKQVGISAVTLHGWQKAPRRVGMVPVRLVPATGVQDEAVPVRLLSPRGYRVEVPDLAAAVMLLRELG
jgi:transposase-like protein